MKTLVLQKPHDIRLVETPAPASPPPGHALVRVHRAGICGTDWHAYHGKHAAVTYPRILGHELGVEIEQINHPQSKLRVGDRCAVDPYMNCGTCIACRNGKTNCCASLLCLGVHTDGGMRERIVLPTHKLLKSEKLTVDQLALVETLAVGCHATGRAAPMRDEWLLLVGAGPIGLSIVPFAQAAGAKVVVAEISESRLRFCRQQFNVPHIIGPGMDVMVELKRLTGGDMPTLVMDATGNLQSMAMAYDYVAPGGRIVMVGFTAGEVKYTSLTLHRKEITVLATRNAVTADFARVMSMIEAGQIDTTPWITHRANCTEAEQAIPTWDSPAAGLVKAIVEF